MTFMISLKALFSISSIVFCLAGSSTYLLSLLKGNTKAHSISWFIWSLVMFIAFLGQYQEGAGYGAWPTLLGAIQTCLIFLLTLKKAETKISSVDIICLCLAILCAASYFASTNVFYSMVLATLVDVLGYFPTIRKTIQAPEEEELRPWVFYGIAPILSLLAIENYNLITIMYPLSIAIMNWSLISLKIGSAKWRGGKSTKL